MALRARKLSGAFEKRAPGSKMVVVAKSDFPDERSLSDEAQISDTPTVISVCGFRLADGVLTDT